MQSHYDIFICYKRKSLPTANNLYYRLTTRGYSTFFDLEDMGRDNFNVQLHNHIEEAKDIFVILEEGSLDACKRDDWEKDWFCHEIAFALEKGKNIIPILINGYRMPPVDFFPDKLKELSYKNAPEFHFSFFEAYLDKLIENGYLLSKSNIERKPTSIFKFYSNRNCKVFKEGKLVCSLEGMSEKPFYLPVSRKGDYRFKAVNELTNETKRINEYIETNEEKNVDITWYDAYICYSRKDYVDEHGNEIKGNPISVVTRILDAGGYTYFIDKEGIYSGDDFAARILRAIESSKLFLFLSSINSNSSKWSSREIALATQLEKQIVPIRIDDSQYSDRALFRIADLESLKYANTSAFENSLLNTIGKLIGRNESAILTVEQRQLNIKSAEERRNGADDYIPKKIDVDIFISYRRVDGRDYARNIMQALKIVGYPKVFFDYNSLRDGVFNTQILDAIYSCKDFILVISPLALKNCGREGDWVSREIRTAIKYNKKIIPIVIEDTFQGWPTDFPKDLSSIKDIHFHKLLTDEYFEDSIEKLAQRLTTPVSTDDYPLGLQDIQSSSITPKETLLYKIKVDRKCRLLIDDEEIQIIEASQLVKIPLPKGEYIRKVVDYENDNCFNEAPLLLLEHDTVDIVSLNNHRGLIHRLFNHFMAH